MDDTPTSTLGKRKIDAALDKKIRDIQEENAANWADVAMANYEGTTVQQLRKDLRGKIGEYGRQDEAHSSDEEEILAIEDCPTATDGGCDGCVLAITQNPDEEPMVVETDSDTNGEESSNEEEPKKTQQEHIHDWHQFLEDECTETPDPNRGATGSEVLFCDAYSGHGCAVEPCEMGPRRRYIWCVFVNKGDLPPCLVEANPEMAGMSDVIRIFCIKDWCDDVIWFFARPKASASARRRGERHVTEGSVWHASAVDDDDHRLEADLFGMDRDDCEETEDNDEKTDDDDEKTDDDDEETDDNDEKTDDDDEKTDDDDEETDDNDEKTEDDDEEPTYLLYHPSELKDPTKEFTKSLNLAVKDAESGLFGKDCKTMSFKYNGHKLKLITEKLDLTTCSLKKDAVTDPLVWRCHKNQLQTNETAEKTVSHKEACNNFLRWLSGTILNREFGHHRKIRNRKRLRQSSVLKVCEVLKNSEKKAGFVSSPCVQAERKVARTQKQLEDTWEQMTLLDAQNQHSEKVLEGECFDKVHRDLHEFTTTHYQPQMARLEAEEAQLQLELDALKQTRLGLSKAFKKALKKKTKQIKRKTFQ